MVHTKKPSHRAEWGSRIGFILAAAGSAIGLGAIWKFPYITGQNGGGAFLLLYIMVSVGIGVALMLAELAVGRATQRSAVQAFQQLAGPVGAFFGGLSLLTAFIILSFYCVVGGWTVGYLWKSFNGSLLDPSDSAGFKDQFGAFSSDPVGSLFFFALFMAMTIGIILGGVQKGIERVSKFLMPVLFILILVMIIRSVTLPGAMAGLEFYLVPDFSKITGKALIEALGFSFFSLSLGFAGMLTYGSYVSKKDNLAKSAVWVVFLQIMCAVMAGFMILPAVIALGFEPGQGPGLTYITLPAVFKAMPGGIVFASIFFSLLLIAALTSSVSIVEPLVSWLIERFKLRRSAASLAVAISSFFVGIPATWSFGGADVGKYFGMDPFTLMDHVSLNILIPINVFFTCLIMGWVVNSVFKDEVYRRYRIEAGFGESVPWWGHAIDFICKYIAPVVIAAIFINQFSEPLQKFWSFLMMIVS